MSTPPRPWEPSHDHLGDPDVSKQIKHLGVFLTLCYVLLFAQLNRYTVFDAKHLQEKPGNHRKADRDFAAPRGTISTADGVLLVSPGYHGTVSGLVKNALDYVEDLRDEPRPYLDGRAVGCVALANGWQAAVTTLTALRSIVHALRGWPTPLGAAVNSTEVSFDADGCTDSQVEKTLRTIGEQVVEFALGHG